MSFVKGLCFGIWSDETAAKTSTTTHKRNNIKTTVKMFFTLGIPYICDLIAWSLLWAYGRTTLSIFAITSVLKVINAAQGFIMFCVIYLDDSKVRKLYQTTITYATRSTTRGSLPVAESRSSVVVKHSMKNGTTTKILPSKPNTKEEQELNSFISNSIVSKSKIEQNENMAMEMKQLKER